MRWLCRDFTIDFPRRAVVMGVINVTPDSFSDGGRHFDLESAVNHGLELVAEGAEILDIGGESTRPGAAVVETEEEIRRTIPVVECLTKRVNIPVSIDTRKPQVAEAALRAGASIVNDVQASRESPHMWELVARYRAGYVAMHMQGQPETMQQHPTYSDVRRELEAFFLDRLDHISGAGVDPTQVVFDPGIGFGKADDHNLALLADIGSFRKLGRPLLVGVSRKSFIGRVLNANVEDRLAGSLACANWCVQKGVQIIRTHDAKATVHGLRMTEALMAARE
ncbi:MAG TPA: dihydropteroate synthase [Candidatus Limnocylindria bacterium]|jgi:dihydropteroate synthase|nr:dihydropteroate synthase [Candidatus Limnocylindria bacterium]